VIATRAARAPRRPAAALLTAAALSIGAIGRAVAQPAQPAGPGPVADAPGGAGAAPTGATAEPALSIAELPPLPPAAAQPSSSATVLAAAAAEEDVVVGAAKREQSLGSVASAVTVITADRIRRFGYRTVGEAVAAAAGAYLVDTRLVAALGIRGLQIPGDFNTRILVLIDGASVNEAWGAFAGVGFDTLVGIDEIDRIELIRGPVSSLYGTSAFFGIINIVTRGATEAPRAWARVGAHAIGGLIASAGFAAGALDRQVRGAVQVMRRRGEVGLALPDGGAIHAAREADGARAMTVSLTAAWGGSFAQLRALRARRASPFAPYDVSPAGPAYALTDTQLLIEGGHARSLSPRLAVAARAYANLYRYADAAPPAEPVLYRLDTSGTAQVFGAEARGRYALAGDALGVTAGVEASLDRTRSRAEEIGAPASEVVDVPARFSVLGAYAELDAQPTRWLGFTGGARLDRHSLFASNVSPRAAVFLAQPDRYGLKLLFAEGFRNPSAFEGFFYDGADFSQPVGLRAETIRSYEAVLWARPRVGASLRLSGFYWDARDLIEARSAAPPEDPNLLQFQNVTRYVSTGLEAEVSWRDLSGWYGFAGAALARVGEAATEMTAVAYGAVINAPRITASAGLSTPRLLGLGHLSTELTAIGARPTRPAAESEVGPRSPAWLGWSVVAYVPARRGWELTVSVRNALGRRDLVPASGDYDRSLIEERTVSRVPGEGREAYVELGYAY
jgi:iron complex outermembrane receptor protein